MTNMPTDVASIFDKLHKKAIKAGFGIQEVEILFETATIQILEKTGVGFWNVAIPLMVESLVSTTKSLINDQTRKSGTHYVMLLRTQVDKALTVGKAPDSHLKACSADKCECETHPLSIKLQELCTGIQPVFDELHKSRQNGSHNLNEPLDVSYETGRLGLVKDGLAFVFAFLAAVSGHYDGIETWYSTPINPGDAHTVLHYLKRGMHQQDIEEKRLERGEVECPACGIVVNWGETCCKERVMN